MAINENAQVSEAIKEINTKDINLSPEPSNVYPFFASDDATGKVLNARQNADLTPAQLAREQFAAEKAEATKAPPRPTFVRPGTRGLPEGLFKDIAGGIIEAPSQSWAGALDAVAEIADLIDLDPMALGAITMAAGGGELGAKTAAKTAMALGELEVPTIETEPRTVTGGLVRGVSQFLTGFLPALKAVKATGKAAPYIAGAIADSAVFDPMEARLSDLVEEVPALSNPVTEYLASSPDDTAAQGRFKNAVEGLALGGATDALLSAVKFIKSGKDIRRVAEETGQPVEDVINKASETKKAVPTSLSGFKELANKGSIITAKTPEESLNAILKKETPAQDINISELPENLQFDYESGDLTKRIEDAGLYLIDDMMGNIVIGRTKEDAIILQKAETPIDFGKSYGYTDEDIAAFYVKRRGDNVDLGYQDFIADLGVTRQLDAVSTDEFIPFDKAAEDASVTIKVPEFKTGAKKAEPERAQNINLARLNTTEDVQNLLDRVAQADSRGINKARREVITNEELPKLADDLGMTVDDLMNRRQGEAFNAEQILAARKILVASGENLMQLSKSASDGGDMELALFRRAMGQHRAIQQQVSGMTAEAGRALQSFNIIAESSRAQQRAIKEALEASGGLEVNQKMAQMFAELDDPAQVGKFVRDANKVTTADMLYEVWINGLLSSPTTHMVNILSNTMVIGLTVGERRLARAIGGNIPPGETTAQMKGFVDGARDGLRLAWKALKTGEPIDVMEKVEVEKRRSVSGESLNIAGPAGRFADYLGEFVRIPGRLLTSEDAFFKSIGYRMELSAQAYRQAFNEGLKDEAAAIRVLEIINNPPENIKLSAIDASRYQTFTNKLGKAGKSIENVRNNIPFARVIMPFVRTPINIMSFTFERTPLAPLMKSVREEIAAGGARRDLALAKITMGSIIMAVSADLTLSGSITGAGPVDRDQKNILRATGWQPYSIRVGDTYYAYNRLDPTGALLGLAADMAEIMGQTTEADAQQLAVAAGLSVGQNMASKTYMSGLVDFMDAFFSSSTDPEANNYKLNSWLTRTAASVVPAGVAALERSISPELTATYGILDRIKSRIPGYSEGLPPRRNIFGEPVVLEGGIGPDIMSPIYVSTAKEDPIADELVAQQVSISMPRRVINEVELDANQYDKYILLYSGQDNKGMKSVPLKAKLKELFAKPGYKRATDGPEGGKALAIQAVFTAYRDSAKAQLIQEDPTLEADVRTATVERVEKLTGR